MGGIVGAVAGIAGPLLGGILGSDAASSAANTQSQGATNAANIAAQSQLAGLEFVKGQEAPYNQAGQLALGRYEQLLGLGGGTGSGTGGGPTGRQRPMGGPAGVGGGGNFDVGNYLTNLPGYQFQLQQGQNAIENSAAARGGALTGNTMQGLQQFGQGLASQQFNQYMTQLAGLTNIGQSAASGTANAGMNLIPGAGASQASGINAAAQYGAAGQLAGYNQLASGITTAFNSPAFQGGIKSLFGGTPNYDQGPNLDPSVFSGG